MRRNGWVLFVCMTAGCLDFDAAATRCRQPDGRCRAVGGGDGGSTAGGGVAGGTAGGVATAGGAAIAGGTQGGGSVAGGSALGGGMAGGASGGAQGGGTSSGGGSAGGTACLGCLSQGMCLSVNDSLQNRTCGRDGAACVNCLNLDATCDRSAARCVAWRLEASDPNRGQWMYGVATGPNEAYFAGNATSFFHFKGSGIEAGFLAGIQATTLFFRGEPGSGTVTVGGAWSSTGARLRTIREPWDGGTVGGELVSVPARVLYDVFGNDEVLYAVGDFMSGPAWFVRDGGGWSDISTQIPRDAGRLFGGWMPADAGDVYLVGTGGFSHRRAQGWVTIPLPEMAVTLAGTSPRRVFLAGDNGSFYRVDDDVVTRLSNGLSTHFWSMWAFDDQHIFVGGTDGTVTQFDWQGQVMRRDVVSQAPVRSVTGWNPFDVWAGDSDGGMWHFTAR